MLRPGALAPPFAQALDDLRSHLDALCASVQRISDAHRHELDDLNALGKTDGVHVETNGVLALDAAGHKGQRDDSLASTQLPEKESSYLKSRPSHVQVRNVKYDERGEGIIDEYLNEELACDTPGFARQTTAMEQGELELAPIWNETRNERRGFARQSSTQSIESINMVRGDYSREQEHKESCWKRLVLRPDSRVRMTWVITGMAFICYDFLSLPFQVFNPPSTVLSWGMTWAALFFWLLDIPITFFTGYFDRAGFTEMRLHMIAKRYIKGWLAYDVTLVTVDWAITVATASESSTMSQFRIGRALRLMRMIRLARLVKVQGRLKDLLDGIQSEAARIIVGIVKLLFFITVLNHLIACSWYGIGQLSQSWNMPYNWIDSFGLNDWPGTDTQVIMYRYTTALHWSWTQFTPASMEVVPKNWLERIFTITILIFAMVTFSSFVSSITNAMTRLRILTSERSENLSLLRAYMTENNISDCLCVSISDFLCAADKESRKQRKKERDVPLLRKLPQSLKLRLQDEVYLPHLTLHPFFMAMAINHPTVMHRMYADVLQELTVQREHHLFQVAAMATHMYFVVAGELTYQRPDSKSIIGYNETIGPGSWLCECALWIDWSHCGECFATKRADLLAIGAAKFQQLMVREARVREPARYAARFMQHFRDQLETLSDFWVDPEVQSQMVSKAYKMDVTILTAKTKLWED